MPKARKVKNDLVLLVSLHNKAIQKIYVTFLEAIFCLKFAIDTQVSTMCFRRHREALIMGARGKVKTRSFPPHTNM